MMASLSGMGQFYGTVNHPGHEGSRRNACYVRHAPRACGSWSCRSQTDPLLPCL